MELGKGYSRYLANVTENIIKKFATIWLTLH